MSAFGPIGVPNAGIDLSSCEQEPIHIPGSIQPFGILIALNPATLEIVQISANVSEILGIELAAAFKFGLSSLFESPDATSLETKLRESTFDENPVYVDTVAGRTSVKRFNVTAHIYGGRLIVELETQQAANARSFHDLYTVVRAFIARLQRAGDVETVCQVAADEIRQITGFGRALVYRFDPDWNGHVVAEARDPAWNSYLDHWFPASDIPPQARRLYELNRVRLIADAQYKSVPMVALSGTTEMLDMSFAGLRSVSPVHLEYLQNMGVGSSLSVSLLRDDGRLWGLLACHHRTPRFVSFDIRTACDLFGQTVSGQVARYEQRGVYERRIELKSISALLLESMAEQEDFLLGLTNNPDMLLSYARARGAAVLNDDRCIVVGSCPPEESIWRVVNWLMDRGREEVYATDCLPSVIPDSEVYRDCASGILAISLSKLHRSYVIWFRPEIVQTLKWAGNPDKSVEQSENEPTRLHPRKSFEGWKEITKERSFAWDPVELESAVEFRHAILGIVLRRAEELAQLSGELQRSNKELEAFTYSVSHDLRAPFRQIVGYSDLLKDAAGAGLGDRELRYIDVIIRSARFAGTLVDELLKFSRVGRAALKTQPIAMQALVQEVMADLKLDIAGRNIEWRISKDLPVVRGDLVLMRLVWQNLIQNAIKYTRSREHAVIEIEGGAEAHEFVFCIRDNGIGFDQEYVDKLFGVFQRLHRLEDYEGTGIGLANVRRIVSRHHGRTWASGETGKGAAFYFSLPQESVRTVESG